MGEASPIIKHKTYVIMNSSIHKSQGIGEREGFFVFLKKQGVCHIVALSFTLKCSLRQKKNYGNANISPCKNIIFKKSS
jgi:hypothetical protein